MASRYFTLLVVFCLSAFKLLADGPPIDTTGHISCNYISVKITKSQKEHLQSHRWLSLNKEQRKKLTFLNLPKFVDVFDPFHHDCTCGQIYGMWYQEDSIAFCVRDSGRSSELDYDDDEIGGWYNNDSNFVGRKNKDAAFISLDGKVFYMDHQISIDDLRKISLENYIFIYLPPIAKSKNPGLIYQTKEKILLNFPKTMQIFWM
jgi:hypothetical protein